MYLQVTPSGGRLWRFKFRAEGGVEKKLALGAYPDVSLKDARAARDAARSLLAKGIDPAQQKRRDKHSPGSMRRTPSPRSQGPTSRGTDGTGSPTPRWASANGSCGWWSGRSATARSAEIAPYEILEAVRPYEAAKNDEKAHRTLQFIGQVFRYAIANQLAPSDPTRDLRGALASRRPKHLAAVLDAKKAGELLRAIDGYEGGALTRTALQLSALLFVRPGELRGAEWSELDFEAGVWRIPAARMKGRVEHAVPLPRQAMELFRIAQGLTGDVAATSSRRSASAARPMSENTVNGALRRLGLRRRRNDGAWLSRHGQHASERVGQMVAGRDRAGLGAQGPGSVRAAYHRGAHWAERVEMAQWWADYLDRLREGAAIVPFRRDVGSRLAVGRGAGNVGSG